MITHATAIEIAKQLVERPRPDGIVIEVNDALTSEHNFGWVIYWNSATYWRTGDLSHAIVGAQPLLIDRRTGELSLLPTAGIDAVIAERELGYQPTG